MTIIQPTSYTEINRLYRAVVAPLKKGVVLVTSTRDGEGATLLSHVLALRSAESGTKTLLVDLNIKNKHLTKSLDLTETNWNLPTRKEKDTFDDLIIKTSKAENLHYIAAPNDMESIAHLKDVDHAKEFFKVLGKTYNKIIVDTTPVGAMNRYNADPVILASAADRTVMVLLSGITPRKRIKNAISQLEEVGATVEGIVFNDWQSPSLKDDVMAMLTGLQGVMPGLANWLRHKVISGGHSLK